MCGCTFFSLSGPINLAHWHWHAVRVVCGSSVLNWPLCLAFLSRYAQIALHLNASSRSRELEDIRRRDHEEIVEMMTRALHDQNFLKMALAHSTPEDAHKVMEVMEQARSFVNATTPSLKVLRHHI
jgi:hypothetical protein